MTVAVQEFWLVSALILTQAWVSAGQWGEEGWYGLPVLAAGVGGKTDNVLYLER